MQGRRVFYKPIRRKQKGGKLADARSIYGALKVVDTPQHLTTIPVGALHPYEPVLVLNPAGYWSLQDITNPHDLGSWEYFEHPYLTAQRLEAKLELLMFKEELELDFINTITAAQAGNGDPVTVETVYKNDFDQLDDKWLLDAWIESDEPIPVGSEITMSKGGNPLGAPIELESPIQSIWLSELMGMINPDASVRSPLVNANDSTVSIEIAVELPEGSDDLTANINFKVITSDDDFEHRRIVIGEDDVEAVFEAASA